MIRNINVARKDISNKLMIARRDRKRLNSMVQHEKVMSEKNQWSQQKGGWNWK